MEAEKKRALEVAYEMYMQKGIRRVSSVELAQKLGISTKSLHEMFGHRNHLLNAVVHEFLERLKEGVALRCKSGRNSVEKLTELFIFILESLRKVNPSFLFELKRRHRDYHQAMVDFGANELLKIVVNIIEDGFAEGMFVDNIPPQCLYKALLDRVVWIAEAPDEPQRGQNEQLRCALLINEIRGITTMKGHEVLDEKYKGLINK